VFVIDGVPSSSRRGVVIKVATFITFILNFFRSSVPFKAMELLALVTGLFTIYHILVERTWQKLASIFTAVQTVIIPIKPVFFLLIIPVLPRLLSLTNYAEARSN
jgi:hypothetical protein